MSINKSKKYIWLFIALTLSGVGVFMLYVAYSEIRSMNEEISLLKSDIDNETRRINEERDLKIALADTSKDREMLNGYFVREDQIVPFVESIESVGTKFGVKVKIVSISDGGDVKNTEESLDLKINFNGSWSSVMNFLEYLENLPYKSHIDNVVFSIFESSSDQKTEGKGGVSLWNVSLGIKVLTSKK
jgi:hypothetical protein